VASGAAGGRPVSEFADVERFIEESRRASTPRALDNLLASISLEMGFPHYAMVHHVDLTPMNPSLSHMSDGTLVALTNYPEAWVEHYVSNRFHEDDPVVLASHRTNVGFKWDETPNLIPITQRHRDIREAGLKAGVDEGYTIPANVPGEANGSCSFALRPGQAMPEERLAMSQLVGAFAFQAARGMVLNARERRAPEPKGPLSQRQLECVVLVARGKSDWEIGRILGISEDTVKFHLKQAREHYDVPRRVQVVMRAIYEGQITLGEVVR